MPVRRTYGGRARPITAATDRALESGQPFHARVHLTVPGGEVVVARDPERYHAHEDVFVAVRDAFRDGPRGASSWISCVPGAARSRRRRGCSLAGSSGSSPAR